MADQEEIRLLESKKLASIKIVGQQEEAINLIDQDNHEKAWEIEEITNKRHDVQMEYRDKRKQL